MKPTTVGRAAVRRVHTEGAEAARRYLRAALSGELSHRNPSMRGNARNTVDGLEHYIAADLADGREFRSFGEPVRVELPSGAVNTKLDVVVGGDEGVAGRAIFWDGPPISPEQARVIAYPYAEALLTTFPEARLSDICVWQARRDNIHRVSVQMALAQREAAEAALAGLMSPTG